MTTLAMTQPLGAIPPFTRMRAGLGGHLAAFSKRRIELMEAVRSDNDGIGAVRIGLFKAAFVTRPDYAMEVLQERAADYQKSRGIGIIARPLLGRGLLTSEREHHRRQRKLIAPAFHHQAIASYAEVVARSTEELLATLGRGQTIELKEVMNALTLTIVNRTLFHAEVGGEAEKVGAAFGEGSQALMDVVSSILPLPWPWPSAGNRRLRRGAQALDEIIYRVIRERQRNPSEHHDVLALLLGMKDEDGEGMTDKEIRDEVITLFLAGHETTANALAWAFDQLERHPEVQEKLIAEARSVLAGRTPTFADLPKLPYALAVLKETMRLYPPAYFVGRIATAPTQIGPYAVPKGTTIFVAIRSIHRRAELYPDPERFDPERFLDGKEKALPKGAYIPFGAGPRVCIGNHFALMEGQLILAAFADRFELRRATPEPPIPAEALITLRPGRPVALTLT
jgi:cytochrome P450